MSGLQCEPCAAGAHLLCVYGPPRRAWVVLDGVGDRRLGQWIEHSSTATHMRRRLSPAETLTVGPVVDVRGTSEARRRYDALPRHLLDLVPAVVLTDELGAPDA